MNRHPTKKTPPPTPVWLRPLQQRFALVGVHAPRADLQVRRHAARG